MSNKESSYKQIIKATSLFGGVQGFGILINILRSKLIAVLLGPTGMGYAALLTSTLTIIDGVTTLGLSTSAVRDIAVANESERSKDVSKVVGVFRKLVWFTGILGSLLTFVFSAQLSTLTFGNEKYSAAFSWLSISLLFMHLTSGQNVLLQGLRKLKYLAQANVLGSTLGLIITIPFYYYLRIEGIVPAMIITSICTFAICYFFSRKITLEKVTTTLIEDLSISKKMLSMGIVICLSNLTTLGAAYLVRIYISNKGGMEEVGLYNAGFAIIGTYVGMVFTAMGTDYYPRLSATSQNTVKTNELINHQAEIAILILAPILCVFFIFVNWVIVLLYTNEFVSIGGMVRFAALGMFFKAVSWSMGYLLLAKGESKIFFWNEFAANSYLLILQIIGYTMLGLEGLGVAFLIGYFLHFLQIYFLAKYRYGFAFEKGFFKIFLFHLFIGIVCFSITRFIHTPFSFLSGTIFILFSIVFSLKELNKRLDLTYIIVRISKKLIRKK